MFNYTKHFIFFSYVLLVLFGVSCASSGAPSGGPDDKTPPKIDSIKSTLNRQTNFKPKQVTLYFDEFVEIKNASKEVLVSPPLTYIPQIKNRGKKVTFTFDDKEILKDDVTYTINFGNAIVDFHAGNIFTNSSFVFSTGNVLDSLSLQGKVYDALTKEPDGDIIVMLYTSTSDSIVRNEKPYYFAKTDKTGGFTFNNIKADTFKVFALKDNNLNLLYDLENEKIAFLDSLLILDSVQSNKLELFSSMPIQTQKILSSFTKYPGKVTLLFNKSPINEFIYSSDSLVNIYTEIIQDSMHIYYENARDSFYIYTSYDTILVKPKVIPSPPKGSKLLYKSNIGSSPILKTDTIDLAFNYPISTFNQSKISVHDNIGPLENVNVKFIKPKRLLIFHPWKPENKYNIILDSAALIATNGLANDSVNIPVQVYMPEQLSSVTYEIQNLDSSKFYTIKIIKDKLIFKSLQVESVSSITIPLKNIKPDRYNVEIIEDLNKNGAWDPANYWKKTQAEKQMTYKGDKLRENWETEVPIQWQAEFVPLTKNTAVPNISNPPNTLKK